MRLSRSAVFAWLAALAFVLLGGLQAWWFSQTFSSEQRQLDRASRLALRQTVDLALKAVGDRATHLPPVQRLSDGTYTLEVAAPITYARADSAWQVSMAAFGLSTHYTMSLHDCVSGQLVLGGLGVPEEQQSPSCLDRENEPFCAHLAVAIAPGVPYWSGRLTWWITTTFVLLVLFGFYASTVWSMRQQRLLAKTRTDLVHNLTHELKTPVTNVALASEVLAHKGNELDAERTAHYVGIIRQENKRLQQQIDQLLEMATLDQGDLGLNKQQVNLHELLNQAMQDIAFRLEERGGSLMASLKAAQPVVWGDPVYLTRALRNLLDNAEKYSPNTPSIAISTHNSDREVTVVVEDQGIGMNETVKRSIFNKFYRAPAAGRKHEVKGFGLGLSYVQSVLRNHHGRITVTSAPGQGSRFELVFPLLT